MILLRPKLHYFWFLLRPKPEISRFSSWGEIIKWKKAKGRWKKKREKKREKKGRWEKKKEERESEPPPCLLTTTAKPPSTNKGTGESKERREKWERKEKRKETEEKKRCWWIKNWFLCLPSCYSELLLIIAHCSMKVKYSYTF